MRTILSVTALCVLALSGCGPMGSGPMPPRLDDNEQKQIDESWDKALTPVDRLDRRAVLVALVLSQAYQAGVDKLTFHSEKKCAAGTVRLTMTSISECFSISSGVIGATPNSSPRALAAAGTMSATPRTSMPLNSGARRR